MNIFKNEEMRQIDGFLYEVNKDADYKIIRRVVGYFFSILFIVFSLFYTCENDLMYAPFYIFVGLYYFGELFLTSEKIQVFHKGITQQKQLSLLKVNRVSQLMLLTPFNYKNYIKSKTYFNFFFWSSVGTQFSIFSIISLALYSFLLLSER